MQSLYAMRKEIIGICKRTYDRGYVAANDGNVSARISDDRVLATPTGMSLSSGCCRKGNWRRWLTPFAPTAVPCRSPWPGEGSLWSARPSTTW